MEAICKIFACFKSDLWEMIPLLDHISVIDEYLNLQSKNITAEQVSIIEGWKRVVHGRFIVERHLKFGSVLVSCDRNDEVYIVRGIYSSWREMLDGFPMPQIVQTLLIPFGNGIVQPYGFSLEKIWQMRHDKYT